MGNLEYQLVETAPGLYLAAMLAAAVTQRMLRRTHGVPNPALSR
jgi:hypothetical protein